MSNNPDLFIDEGAAIYVRFLVAAEDAVLRGQFNVAKVLRALAASQRAQAMTVARSLAEHTSPDALLASLIARIEGLESASLPQATVAALKENLALAQTTLESLQVHPDVPEWIVHQRLYTCIKCGNIVQESKPKRCNVCGVLSTEFEFFGPFYGSTPEHLGQLMPAEIIEIVGQTPLRLGQLCETASEQQLEAKPSAQEWSVKEIIGHLIETDVMFMERVESLRGGTAYQQSLPPWKLHEGKGYEEMETTALLATFHSTRRDVVEYISALTDEEWVKTGILLGESRSVIDTGTWLANNDRGHLAQIERQIRDYSRLSLARAD